MPDADDVDVDVDEPEPQAVCQECGESHDGGACWDEGDGSSEGDAWPALEEGAKLEFDAGELVAVDFDGTLTHGRARYWLGEIEEPREAVCEWVRQQYYAGAHVVVWTARPWSQANVIAARLTEWEVPFHGIRCSKGGADGYIDDKATRPSEVETARQEGAGDP